MAEQELDTNYNPPEPEDPRFPKTGLVDPRIEKIQADSDARVGWLEQAGLHLQNSFGGMGVRRIQDEYQENFDALSTSDDYSMSPLQFMQDSVNALGVTLVGQRLAVEEWDKEKHKENLLDGIPWNYHEDIMDSPSVRAAYRARARITDSMDRQRKIAAQGKSAQFHPAMMLDIDIALVPVTGGAFAGLKAASMTSKMALQAGLKEGATEFLGRVAAAAPEAALTGVGTSAAGMAWDESFGWTEAAMNALVVTGAGTALSAASRRTPAGQAAAQGLENAKRDLERRVLNQDPALHTPVAGNPTAHYTTPAEAREAAELEAAEAQSLGAAAVPGQVKPGQKTDLGEDPVGTVSATTQEWTDAHREWRDDSGWAAQKEAELEEGIVRMVGMVDEQTQFIPDSVKQGAHSFVTGSNLINRLWRSNAESANFLVGEIYESPTGLGRGSTTAAIMSEVYENRALAPMMAQRQARNAWAQNNGQTVLGSGYGSSNKGTKEFDRLVRLELNNREFKRPTTDDPHVKAAADSHEEIMRRNLDHAVGREGERGMDGWENIKDKPNYQTYTWNSAFVYELLNNGRLAPTQKASRKILVSTLAQAYQKAGLTDGADASIIAKAVVARMVRREVNTDTSLLNLLTKDGQEFLDETLADNGIDKAQRESILRKLTGDRSERSQMGNAKRRTEADLDTVIPTADGTDLRIVDLLGDSLEEDTLRYTRRVSRGAALARKGITNRAQRSEINSAVQAQQRALGEEPISSQELDAMWSHFDGGAIKGTAGGSEAAVQSPYAAVVRKAAVVSMLGQMALTQLIETGALIAGVGVDNWMKRQWAPMFNTAAKADRDKLLNELGFLAGTIGHDPILQGARFSLDDVSGSPLIVGKFNSLLQQGVALNGVVSGMNVVLGNQQKVAAAGITDRVFQKLRAASQDSANNYRLSEADYFRMRMDLGLDEPTVDRLMNLVDDGTIVFNEWGGVAEINSKVWDLDLQDAFGAGIKRKSGQVVQRQWAGEQDPWVHTSLGSVLAQFTTFTMAAISKQAFRGMRAMDQEAALTLLLGMATAYMAIAVKDQIAGREFDGDRTARMAFQYAGITGWVTPYWDGAMSILGLDRMQVNPYAGFDWQPPAVSWAQNAANLPEAIGDVARGDTDYETRQAFRALPYSNVIGLSQLLDQIAAQ